MKKFGIRLPVLCAALLLIGVTAVAVSKSVSAPEEKDAHVTVKLTQSESGDPMFVVKRDNATKGKNYLLVIRNGPEEADPTEENIFYMDVETAESDVVTFSNAYPKDMGDGPYRVFMSDYAENGDYQLQQVATFSVGKEEPTDIKLGFVVNQNNTEITATDALYALYISVGKTLENGQAWTETQRIAANVDGDEEVTATDALWILERSVGQRDSNWQKVG